MNKVHELLAGVMRTPHTSVPGLVILGCAVGEIWWPEHAVQWSKTRQFAMSYGFLMASQVGSKPQASNLKPQGSQDGAGI